MNAPNQFEASLDETRRHARETVLIRAATDITVAALSAGRLSKDDVSTFVGAIHATLAGLGAEPAEASKPTPAVNPQRSVFADHIVCLEDGKKFKSLKRHIMTHYGLTPDQYRERWGLPPTYPMVAPNYSQARSALAKKMGLGRKPHITMQRDAA